MKHAAALLGSILLLSLAPGAHAGEALAHEKYQLDNGLTVILHPDHKLPQVVVNLWYHVGTREEPLGRSGFAHLFEHLMFMGTTEVPDNQFDFIMESNGARNNASTWFDRTNYYDWGPASTLPTLLWLEADRMRGLGAAMTQKKLDLQRDVVRNERREGYDDAPYGPSELIVWERMYPVDHPYHFHVIGSHEDLVAATVEDVVGFYDTYYVPNNATMVVAGDFQPGAVKPLIQELFGAIPRGNVPPRRSTPEARLERVERLTVDDKVKLPRVSMVWHTPAFYAPGDAEMDLIAAALTEGENGRLRRRLMRDEQLAVDVDAWQVSLRLGSLFSIQATAKEGVSLARIEAVIDEELRRIRREGPTAREIRRAVANLETRTLTGLQSLREAADLLNQYDAHLGHPDRVDWDLDRYRKATPASVRQAARQHLPLDRRFILQVVPRKKPAASTPDEGKRPAPFTQAAFEPPDVNAFQLKNGLRVWHVDRPGLPLVAATLLLPGGSVATGKEQAGLAQLTATMMTEGAGDMDALAFADALEVLGAQFGVAANRDDTSVSLVVLKRNLDKAVGLMAQALIRPRFAPKDLERRRSLQVAKLEQLVDEPPAMARRVAAQAYFGADPYALPLDGYPATVGALTIDDVRAFHRRWHTPRGSVLLVAGDIRADALRTLLVRHLRSWPSNPDWKPPEPLPVRAAEPDETALRVVLVDKPGATQTVVRFMYPGVGYEHESRVDLEVLNSLFGGSFTSRLMANLREKHGYTYGARSGFYTLAGRGAFVASSNVQTNVTGAALKEFFAEFERIRGGDVDDAEAVKAKATVRYDVVQEFQSLSGVVEALTPYARYGLSVTSLKKDLDRLDPIDAARLNALAARHIASRGGVLVLVGDRAAILPQLEGLDLPAPAVATMVDALAGRLGR